MSVNLSPIGDDAPFIDASGNPLNAGLLYTYTAGSTTPQNTYTTSAGSVANANPIVLDSNGYPSNGSSVVSIWLTGGVSYKFVLKTSAGVTVWTRDNISGINDTTVSVSEWVSGPAPTYVSATSFTLVGDQTSTFNIGRRVKTTNSGGTIYSTISNCVYGALTTVTVVNDSGTLDAGLSAVSYGLLSASNFSVPKVALQAVSINFGQSTLNNYTEGTWTPSLGGNTTYNAQSGKYTRVGRLVFVEATINVNSLGTGSTANVSGLPYTIAGVGLMGGGVGFYSGLAGGNFVWINSVANSSLTSISFSTMAAAGVTASSSAAIFGNSARIDFCNTFTV